MAGCAAAAVTAAESCNDDAADDAATAALLLLRVDSREDGKEISGSCTYSILSWVYDRTAKPDGGNAEMVSAGEAVAL